jgi:hypothetical protein
VSQTENVAIAQQLLAVMAEGKARDALAVMFAEELHFEIQEITRLQMLEDGFGLSRIVLG